MANYTPIEDETNLGGVLVTAIESTDGNGATFTAKFFDVKTGEQRTPQTGTTTLLVNKDSSKAERIRTTGSYSTDSNGITTVTLATNGRALPMYGTGAGTTTGNRHDPGSPIGSVTNHEGVSQINAWIAGSVSSGANALRIGNETDSDIYIYAQNADANKPFLAYLAASNAWVFSNDGSSSTAIGSGASAYTGGGGVDITGSVVSVDLTDATKFASTSTADRAILSNGSGLLDYSFLGTGASVTAANLDTLTDGSNADALHTHVLTTTSVTTAEAIDGSTTPQAVSILGANFKKMILNPASGQILFSTATGTQRNFGNVDIFTRNAQSFVVTDAEAASITLETMTVMLDKIGGPTDNVSIEIQGDSSGSPDGSAITNGTSGVIAGGSISTDEQPVKFTWSTPPTITSGTTYWAVIKRSGANDAANYYAWRDSNANNYAGGSAKVYTASTTSWSAFSNDFQFVMIFSLDYEGDIMKTDSNSLRTGNFVGFTKSNVAADASANLSSEAFVSGFTSLSPGAPYYASTTAGTITDTPAFNTSLESGQAVIRVGRAIADDTIEISPEFYRVYEDTNIFTSGQPLAAASGAIDIFFECGFKPEWFEIRYTITDVGGTATDDRYVRKKFLHTTELETFYISAFGLVLASASSSITTSNDDTVVIQDIYENGALIRFTSGNVAETLNSLQIIAKR